MSRVAVVTGGTRGIGAAISKALVAAGCKVAATYHGNDEAAAKFKAETGVNVYKWDVSNYDACVAGLAQVVKDLDLVEANEAFAAQALAVNKDMGWDPGIVNVNGGAIAIGHPIGASGARVLVSLLHEMQRRNAKKGLATLCIGGGMGIALTVER